MSHALKLERWLGQAPGPHGIGQVAILNAQGNSYALRHIEDREADGGTLRPVDGLAELREIVKTDAAGAFRPLRGAPTLRRGWRMEGLPSGTLLEALNIVYPTAVALWAARERPGGAMEFLKGMEVTEFAETARRQTGMYRITQVMTEEQLAATVKQVCDADCLRERLWKAGAPSIVQGEGIPRRSEPSDLPLLCPEACNYFIAQARERIVADKKDAGA